MSQKIAVTISETGNAMARTLACILQLDDEIVSERMLTPVESQQVRDMAGQYASLFQKGCSGRAAQDYLSILGGGLFQIFLERAWPEFGTRISSGGDLTIESNIPEVLQLPWEFLKFPGEETGPGEKFTITRRPKAAAEHPPVAAEIRAGPLRVLFAACEPLDYAREEEEILRAVEGLDVLLQVGDMGTHQELKRLAGAFRPHLVHLMGQGRMVGGRALFGMQDEDGRPETRGAEDLAAALKESGVQCIILGGCQNEQPQSLDLLAQDLAEHLPLAVAWNGSAAAAAPFYRALAQGKSIGQALGEARREIDALCLKEGRVCPLPVLYSAAGQQPVFDAGRRTEGAADSGTVRDAQEPLPGMTDGQAYSFVNRRKDLQRLSRALREGTARTVIITGESGSGKSVLATRLARRLSISGYSTLVLYSSRNNPLSAARLLESFIGFLTGIGQAKEAQDLRDAETPLPERLKRALDLLNAGRYVILWDGLDLEEKTDRIRDAELAEFYLGMLRALESSRVIITCRSLPSDALTLPKRAWEWPLAGLSRAAFVKFLLQDRVVAARYRRREVAFEELLRLCTKATGSPGFLAPATDAARMGAGIQSREEILEAALSSLSSGSRLALGRAAVYGAAADLSGLAAAAGVPEKEARDLIGEWEKLMLASPVGKLWTIQPFLRPQLQAALNSEERLAAEKAAGAFLRDLADEGRAAELGLSRLDCMLEARGHLIAAGEAPAARAVTSRISGFMERRGYYAEMIRQNLPLLEMEKHPEPMNWIAQSFMNLGNFAMAAQWYGRALESGPDAAAAQGLGMLQLRQGRNDLALEAFRKAEEICRAAGDSAGVAAALHGLASIDTAQKNYDAAMEKMERILKLLQETGDRRGQAATLQNMALLDLHRDNREAARPRLEKALAVLEELKDRSGTAEAQYRLASLDLDRGDFELAAEEFHRAQEFSRGIGDRRGEAAVLHNLGLIASQRGDMQAAWEDFSGSLHAYQELSDRPGEAGAFFQLGALAVQMDRMPEGLRLMALAAVVLRSIKSDEVKNVEPMVERLAAKLNYSQEGFMAMVQEVLQGYLKDRGWGLVEKASTKK